MTDISRRDALQAMVGIPLVAAGLTPGEVTRAAEAAREAIARTTFTPAFFTPDEYTTVRILSELVIPRDGRSGGALDAGVPQFMDFILAENAGMQVGFRGGLAWLGTESRERFGKDFATLADGERRQILDDIAWPKRAKPEHSPGVAFFNRFRDLTASGYFSSELGVKDLQYIGNTFVTDWQGCPPEALAKLGVRY